MDSEVKIIQHNAKNMQEFANEFDTNSNSSKPVAMQTGKSYKVKCKPPMLGGSEFYV